MSIIKDFIVKAGILVQGTSSTVSTGSGALIVQGGAGIAGSLYAGGIATLGAINPGTGSTTTVGSQTLRITAGGIGVNDDSYINGALRVSGKIYSTDATAAASTNSAAVTLIGGLGVGGGAYFGGQVFVQGAGVVTTATLANYGVSAIFGGTDTIVTSSTGIVYVYNTSTLQSITNRGAVTTNAITVNNNTAATTTATGALIIQNGGLGVGGNAFIGGRVSVGATLTITGITIVLDTTESSSVSSGALQVGGGLGVAKNLTALSGVITSASSSTSVVASNAFAITSGGLGVAGSARIEGAVVLSNATNGVNTNSGQALLVTGGVGVGQNLVAGKVITKNTEVATTVGAGSLQVAGGAYVGNNLVVMGTAASTGTTSSNALYVAGGVGIEGSLFVGGPVTFSNPVTFNGTATFVLSTNTYYTDNILEIHVPPGGLTADWTVDDGKDIGLRFHYYTNGTDTNAALVLDNSSKELHWYSSGAESLGGDFSTATYGVFRTASIALTSSTQATSTNTGALRISGGIGAWGNLFLGGNGQTASSSTVNAQTIVVDAGGIGVKGASYFQDGLVVGGAGISATGIAATGGTADAFAVGTQGLRSANGIGITGASYLNGALRITGITTVTNTTNASATNTGALQVVGGVGIGQDLRVGGTIYGNLTGTVTTATNLAGGTAGGIPIQTAAGATAFVPIGANGYVLSSNGSTATWTALGSITAGTATNALNVAVTGTDAASAYFPAIVSAVYPSGSIYTPIWSTSTFSIVPRTGVTTFEGTVDSTTSTAGTIIVKGGVGIAKAVVIGSTLTNYGPHLILNTATASSTQTGALQVSGGAGIGGSLYAVSLFDAGTRVVSSVTPVAGNNGIVTAVSTSGAAVTLTIANHGVVSLAGSTYVGVSASTGSVTLTNLGVQTLTAGTDTAVSSSTGTVTVWNTSTLQTITNRGWTTTNAINITNATAATSTQTGALVVVGGGGFGGSIYHGGSVVRTGNMSANAWGTTGIGFVSAASTYNDLTSNGAVASTAIHSLGQPTITASGGTISAITDAATLYIANAPTNGSGVTAITNAWALQIANGNVRIAATTVNNGNVTSGALQVGGGVGIAGALTVGGLVQAGTAASGTAVNGFQSNNLLLSSYTSNSISTTATVNLDIWSTSTYRSARYSIQLVDTVAVPNRIHYTEMVLIHDGNANVYKSEYGVITNIGELGTFDATVTTSGVQLTFTPSWPTLTPSALVVKSVRTTIS
jgi:hypothetical protein